MRGRVFTCIDTLKSFHEHFINGWLEMAANQTEIKMDNCTLVQIGSFLCMGEQIQLGDIFWYLFSNILWNVLWRSVGLSKEASNAENASLGAINSARHALADRSCGKDTNKIKIKTWRWNFISFWNWIAEESMQLSIDYLICISISKSDINHIVNSCS